MMAVMKKSGCCKKQQDNESKACHAEAEAPLEMELPVEVKAPVQKPSCHKTDEVPASSACAADESSDNPEEKKCSMQDATCVCICCFQYAAPDQVAAKLQFGLTGSNNSLAGYLQQHWKDPHLTAPWQPPDMI